MSYILNNQIKFEGDNNLGVDAGGRLRVSTTTILGDYKQLNQRSSLLLATTGSGTFDYDLVKSKTIMSVTGSEYCVYQTKQWHPYQSGKSNQIELTCTDFHIEAGVAKRIGYYSDATSSLDSFSGSIDGISIFNDGTDYFCQVHRSGEEIHSIPRSEWDDPLDGTGKSGYSINWENFSVFGLDFLWLGGTAVRFFSMVSGSFTEFHKISHAGFVSDVMMTSPNQPLRMEIRGSSNSGTLSPVCAQVTTEGSKTIGVKRAVTLEGNARIEANTTGTRYVLMGLRLKPNQRNIAFEVASFGGISLTNDAVTVELLLNPTLSTAATWTDIEDSALQVAYGDTVNDPSTLTITDTGTRIGLTIVPKGGAGTPEAGLADSLLRAGSDINGDVDEVWVSIKPHSPQLNCTGFMVFSEY